MIVSGLMSAFAKLEALATYVTTVPLFLSVPSLYDTTQNGLSSLHFSENLNLTNSWFPFPVDVITWNGIFTPLMGTSAENKVKSCKYAMVVRCL